MIAGDGHCDLHGSNNALPESRLRTLRLLLAATIAVGGRLELTVLCGGMAISGTAVAPAEWLRAVGARGAPGARFGELLEEMATTAEPGHKRLPDELRHVHLVNSSVWAPGAAVPTEHGSFWQLDLDRIAGWTFGDVAGQRR